MFRLFLILTAITAFSGLSAQAATVLIHDVGQKGDVSLLSSHDGLVAKPLVVGDGLKAITSNALVLRGFDAADRAGARAAADAISFGFTADRPVTLATLTFTADRHRKGPQHLALDVELDGILHALVATQFDPAKGGHALRFDLSGLGSARSVTLRLLGWDAAHKNGAFSIASGPDGIRLTGSTAILDTGQGMAPIPVPPAGILLLGGLGALALRRRAHGAAVRSD